MDYENYLSYVIQNAVKSEGPYVFNPPPYGTWKWHPGVMLYDSMAYGSILYCPKHGKLLKDTGLWCDGSNNALPPRYYILNSSKIIFSYFPKRAFSNVMRHCMFMVADLGDDLRCGLVGDLRGMP
jgi:hypothetical protein